MITLRKSEDRGHADHGWLDTYHTFSFASYHDPDFMGFSVLRVINQDRVRAGEGFGTHGHQEMEIVSYVLDGVLEHKDSMGSGSRMHPGDVQLMSAGTGLTHSEFNGSPTLPLEFLQIWILPSKAGTSPSYEQRSFPEHEREGRLRLIVSPDGRDGSLSIGQDVNIHAALLDPGQGAQLELSPGRRGWLHLARGSVELNGHTLHAGDGARIEAEPLIKLEGLERAELVMFDLP
jgi:quercetin 2,3-dioxygenase